MSKRWKSGEAILAAVVGLGLGLGLLAPGVAQAHEVECRSVTVTLRNIHGVERFYSVEGDRLHGTIHRIGGDDAASASFWTGIPYLAKVTMTCQEGVSDGT